MNVGAKGGVVVSHAGDILFVADVERNAVHVVDLDGLSTLQTVLVPAGASTLCVAPDDRRAYVASGSQPIVTVIERP